MVGGEKKKAYCRVKERDRTTFNLSHIKHYSYPTTVSHRSRSRSPILSTTTVLAVPYQKLGPLSMERLGPYDPHCTDPGVTKAVFDELSSLIRRGTF